MMISVTANSIKRVARSYYLFSQSEGFSDLFGQLIILHVFIERSIYGKPESGGVIDEESDFHEFGGGGQNVHNFSSVSNGLHSQTS